VVRIRPRVTADLPVRAADGGVDIDVLVVPRAAKSRVVGIHGDRLKVQIAAPPVDGAANEALVELFARLLDVGKRELSITAGSTGKRKRVRVLGIDVDRVRARLASAGIVLALACAALGTGCKPLTTDLDVDVIVPEDAVDLGATDNVSAVLDPGPTITVPTDGLEFGLELELDPDDTLRTLTLYLAQQDDLLAWGRTFEFTLERREPVGIFVGRPGRLSTYPLALELDDDGLQAAYVAGRGLVLLASDGATTFIDEISWTAEAAATLETPPPASDGVLVGDALGGAARVRWAEAIGMQRFDVGEDTWIDVELAGADDIAARPGAAWWVDADGTALWLFGGGTATDVVRIDLVPTDDGPTAQLVPDVVLDGPRVGGTAAYLARDGSDDGEHTLVCGGQDDLPLVRLVESGSSHGPLGPWTGARCVQVDRGPADAVLRMLCGGGIRADEPTADAIELRFGPAGSMPALEVTEHPDLLGLAMPDVVWLVDDVAVYAQGEGQLRPFTRDAWAPIGMPLPALRASGGTALPLPTGATVLAGGQDTDAIPTARMQVFVPDLPPSP